MAFYLHSADIDKARAIAERALKTISFRLVDFQFEIIFWKGSCILEWIEILQEIYCQGIFQESFNESLLQNTFFVLFPLSIFSCFPSPCSLFPFPFSLFPFPFSLSFLNSLYYESSSLPWKNRGPEDFCEEFWAIYLLAVTIPLSLLLFVLE